MIGGIHLERILRCLALALFCFAPMHTRFAFAETGIRALDEAAIAVKAPDKVVLIAIARAGKRLVAVGEHGVITYSDDNGRSWKQASVPVTVTLTCVAFADENNGWAAGHYGVILHTTDGGATWQLQLTGLQANQLTLDAANQAVAQDSGSASAKMALRRANFFMAAGPDKPFLSILPEDANNAIVFGSYRMTMKTTDSGKDWVDWSQHIGDPLSHNLYDVTIAGSDIYAVGEIGLVFRSTDGGNSFPEVTSPAGTTMFGAVGTSGSNIFVFGVAGQAFRSDDEGKDWAPVFLGTQANLTAGLRLSSGAILLGSEDGALYISWDNAVTFKPMPDVLPMALFALAQAENGDVIAAGNLGVMRVSAQDFVKDRN